MALTQSYKSREKVLGNISELVRRIRNINSTTERYVQDATRYGIAYSEIATVANARLAETDDLFLALQAEFTNVNWEHQQYIKTNDLLSGFQFNQNINDSNPSLVRPHFFRMIGIENPWTLLEEDDKWTLEQGQNRHIFQVVSDPSVAITDTAILQNTLWTNTTGWTFGTGWATSGGYAVHTAGNTAALSQANADISNKLTIGQAGIFPVEIAYDATPAGSISITYEDATSIIHATRGADLFYHFSYGTTGTSNFVVQPSTDFNGKIKLRGSEGITSIDSGRKIAGSAIEFYDHTASFDLVTNAAIRLLDRAAV